MIKQSDSILRTAFFSRFFPPMAPELASRSTPTAIACPVLTLPVEITIEIFTRCIPEDRSSEPRGQARSPMDEPPILLTRVCRIWRDIALATPSLWSRIHLEVPATRSGYLDPWWVNLLDTWLTRAQNRPLSVLVSNLNHHDPDGCLAAVLASHSRRWQEATLELPFHQFHDLDSIGYLGSLQTLSLQAYNTPRDVPQQITAFHESPLLSRVSLGSGIRYFHLSLPWGQLSSLEFALAKVRECVECLHHTPRLASAVFQIEEDVLDAATAFLSAVPPLMQLRSISISGFGATNLLSYINAPALDAFDFSSSLTAQELSAIRIFFERSGCELRRLKLHYISDLLTMNVVTLLTALPFLESLDLGATEARTFVVVLVRLLENHFGTQLQRLAITHHRGGVVGGACEVGGG
ncbi:hypothetical protein FB45DRAFT_947919 [Roridomyces roridus]|uniref:F-box domain-containing protein n=1 Tax=Roridomyces roridus TaxID=1738132 RepID=A0AAD7B2J8_9AGAR|nr:hypothetical protein FB45DRAFT_947919 [Roridomyces roridus]